MEGRDFIPPFVIPPFPRNLDLRDAPLYLAVVFARPAALARRCLHADIEAELSREPPNLREALLAAFALARRKQLLRPRDHRAQLFIGPRLQRGERHRVLGREVHRLFSLRRPNHAPPEVLTFREGAQEAVLLILDLLLEFANPSACG